MLPIAGPHQAYGNALLEVEAALHHRPHHPDHHLVAEDHRPRLPVGKVEGHHPDHHLVAEDHHHHLVAWKAESDHHPDHHLVAEV